MIVGSLAGSKVGECVYEGAKAIGKAAVSTVKSVGRAVYSGAKTLVKAAASFWGFDFYNVKLPINRVIKEEK